jgi:hypothetical protein
MAVDSVSESRLPPGWWIFPTLAGSLAFWGAAIWLVMR